MNAAKRDADEYPDIIEAEASNGVLVQYMKTSEAKERERLLLEEIYGCGAWEIDAVYKKTGLKELK